MSETIGRCRGRLLFDCTHVFRHPWSNSGIQRVVRNIVRELPLIDSEMECLPVALVDGQLRQVTNLLADDAASRRPPARWYAYAEEKYHELWKFHASFDSGSPSLRVRIMKQLTVAVCHLLYPPLMVAKRLRNAAGLDPVQHRIKSLELCRDDTLVLLDSTWHDQRFIDSVEQIKTGGMKIVAVIYDLIPIRHPNFCDESLVEVFERWFQWCLQTADAFVCISNAVRQDVVVEARKRLGSAGAARKAFRYFHLASELDLKKTKAEVHDALADIFSSDEPVSLMVSTIEPRKNHSYLLDAFELVWAGGGRSRLCLIGKVGWKCDALLSRIRSHPQLGTRLFLLSLVDDDGLEYAYANASVLVFPSLAEGFGLPLVEAMQRGLPVIASDIPVFRETGGDFVAYCDIRNPASLARMILELEKTGKVPSARDLKDWKWITWRESAQQLVEAVRASLEDVPKRGERDAPVA